VIDCGHVITKHGNLSHVWWGLGSYHKAPHAVFRIFVTNRQQVDIALLWSEVRELTKWLSLLFLSTLIAWYPDNCSSS
jgi:hypothetical protein